MADFSVYGQPTARTTPSNESMLRLPSDAELAAMGMTAQQFADLQNSISGLSGSSILSGPLDLIGGSSPYSRTINEADYMIGAPKSNKGNPTSTMSQSSNDFFVYDNQPVRLVDNRTGQVVFEGAGPADAKKASEMAAQLTAEGGRKATWDIQTGPGLDVSMYGADQNTGWKTVAHEKKNNSALGTIADIALPVAASLLVPGSGFLGTILPAAAGSAASSVAQGRSLGSTLLRAGLAGAGSGLGEAIFPPATGAISVGGNAATNVGAQTVANAAQQTIAQKALEEAAKKAGEEIVVTALTKAAPSIAGGALGSALGGAAPSLANAIASKYPAYNPAEPRPTLLDRAPVTAPVSGIENLPEIVATANRAVPTSVGSLGGGVGSTLLRPFQSYGGENYSPSKPSAETPDPELSKPLVVTANLGKAPVNILPAALATGTAASLAAAANAAGATANPAETRAGMTAGQTGEVLGTGATGTTLADIGTYMRLAGLGTGVLGSLFAKKNPGSGVNYPGAGTGNINPIYKASLPTPSIPGASGNFAVRPQSDFATAGGQPRDWNQYGFGPEASFFNYVPQRGYSHGGRASHLAYEDLTPEEKNYVDYHRRNMAVMPYVHDGNLTTVYGMIDRVNGGEMLHPGYIHGKIKPRGEATDWAVRSGIDFPVYPNAQTAIAREKQIHDDIIDPDTARYMRGDRDWLSGYSHGGGAHGDGPDRSFAVRGPGDGRSDDIPAVLSDGEYVMDAETVSLLGNGSSKAGAEALDRFRVNLRKHKGKALAKGKFSVNAKRPERYLAGGRI